MKSSSTKDYRFIMRRVVVQRGFTLIELAIVLTIVGLLLGSSLSSYSQWRSEQKYREVKLLLERLQHSVLGYAMSYGELPCPASLNNSDASTRLDQQGNCRSYQGGFPASVYGAVVSTNEAGLVLDPWNRPIRFALSKNNDTEMGDSEKDDWVNSQEIRTIGASRLDVSITICIDHTKPCSVNSNTNLQAVLLLYSLGADGTGRGKQYMNQDGDSMYLHAPFHQTPGLEFDDVLTWVGKNELIYWLVRSAQLP